MTDFVVVPTINRWDAPFAIYHHRDGRVTLRRDYDLPEGEVARTDFFPHAVLMLDGELSPFDAARQPTEPLDPFAPWRTP